VSIPENPNRHRAPLTRTPYPGYSFPVNPTSPASPATASRRAFLKTTGTAAAGSLLASRLTLAQGFQPNSDTLKVGLIGCGGRGTGAAGQALRADPNVVLTAMGDVFRDAVESSFTTLKNATPDRVQVPPTQRFAGLDAYQKVIDSGVDVVLLAAPPGFRPAHVKAAVAAGKHMFCEKPVATDAAGIRTVLAAAEVAKAKNSHGSPGSAGATTSPAASSSNASTMAPSGELRAVYATITPARLNPCPPPANASPV
jgi:hypothetical protein